MIHFSLLVTYFLLLITGLYAIMTLTLLIGWIRMEGFSMGCHETPTTKITVIIPVRNEAKWLPQLLQDLENQNFPTKLLQIIIANDGSTDETEAIIKLHQYDSRFQWQLFDIEQDTNYSPKKRAISQAMVHAQGELIVSTDGDCRVGVNWLRTIESFYRKTQAKLISSPVTFVQTQIGNHSLRNLFTHLQTIEFASLVGTGAVSMFLKKPNMCNGANLAYSKEAFEEVGGFAGSEQVASGDDEFLMHKIFARYPDQVFFLKSAQAVVSTQVNSTWQDFYQQRKRWASKWKFYQNWQVSALAIFIFTVNFGLLIGVFGGLFGLFEWRIIFYQIVLKCTFEFIFLGNILRFFGHLRSIKWILLAQFMYPFYVSLFALVAQYRGYTWKGRNLE